MIRSPSISSLHLPVRANEWRNGCLDARRRGPGSRSLGQSPLRASGRPYREEIDDCRPLRRRTDGRPARRCASHATRHSRGRAVAASSCCCFRRVNERVVRRRLGNPCGRHSEVPSKSSASRRTQPSVARLPAWLASVRLEAGGGALRAMQPRQLRGVQYARVPIALRVAISPQIRSPALLVGRLDSRPEDSWVSHTSNSRVGSSPCSSSSFEAVAAAASAETAPLARIRSRPHRFWSDWLPQELLARRVAHPALVPGRGPAT
jgi:hypothetical protein